MKKFNFWILFAGLLAFAGLSLTSCNDDDPPIVKPVITLDSYSATFTDEGGEKPIEVTITPQGTAWEVEKSESWVEITNETTAGFTIKVAAWTSETETSRKATVTVKAKDAESKTITVEQTIGTPPVDEFEVLDTEDIEFDADGGQEVVRVKSSVEWEAKGSASWIIIEDAENGFTVKANENDTEGPREGTVTVTPEGDFEPVLIKVSQKYEEPQVENKLEVNIDNLAQTPGFKAQEIEFSVDANVDFIFDTTVNTDEDGNVRWLTVRDEGDDNYVLVLAQNNTSEARTATIVIKNENELVDPVTITVTQGICSNIIAGPGVPSKIISSGVTLTGTEPNVFPAMNGTPVGVYTEAEWMIVDYYQGDFFWNIDVSAEVNPSSEERSAMLYIYGTPPNEDSISVDKVKITQQGA